MAQGERGPHLHNSPNGRDAGSGSGSGSIVPAAPSVRVAAPSSTGQGRNSDEELVARVRQVHRGSQLRATVLGGGPSHRRRAQLHLISDGNEELQCVAVGVAEAERASVRRILHTTVSDTESVEMLSPRSQLLA